MWRYEDRRAEKSAKIPYNPRSGDRAKSNEPRTWGTLDEALRALKRDVRHDKLPDYLADAGFKVPGIPLPPRDDGAYDELRREIEAEKKAQAERDRLEAEADLKDEIRERFLKANPAASEKDFNRLYLQLRDAYLVGSVGSRSTVQKYIEAVYGDS